jgi:hypothetical protein
MNRAEQDSATMEQRMTLEGEPHSPLESYAGRNFDMQLLCKICSPGEDGGLKAGEKQALARMKEFCSCILKTLAPPLMREVESASMLHLEAEPFTPRRSLRLSTLAPAGSRTSRKASAAETALLKALGVSPDQLTTDDEAIKELKQLFDSPLRDRQLHVLAAIFGKTMPARQKIQRMGSVEISVSA